MQWQKAQTDMTITYCITLLFCKTMTGRSLYLNHGQHAFVIVWVGVDRKVVVGISVNDRVDGSPSSCGRVISIIHCQVHHDAFRAFIH